MIKFPRISIAASTVNRILNAADSIGKMGSPAVVARGAPNVPDAAPLGAALDTAIAEPTGPVSPTEPGLAEELTTAPLFP